MNSYSRSYDSYQTTIDPFMTSRFNGLRDANDIRGIVNLDYIQSLSCDFRAERERANYSAYFARLSDSSLIESCAGGLRKMSITSLLDVENMTDWNHFSGILQSSISREEIRVTRPLNEFISHIKNRQIPRLQLIVRVIKTLVLGVFRFHLSDSCLFYKDSKYIHSLDGEKVKRTREEMDIDYPYMLENTVTLILKNTSSPKVSEEFLGDSVTADSIRDYFYRAHSVEITKNKSGNSIRDLLNSKELEVDASILYI